MQPQVVNPVQKEHSGQRAQPCEAPGLKKGGLNVERERGSHLIPESVIVASDDMELIPARAKIRVERLTARTGVHPVLVETIEPVLEEDSVGISEAERGVVELKARKRGRKAGRAARVDRFAVHERFVLRAPGELPYCE